MRGAAQRYRVYTATGDWTAEEAEAYLGERRVPVRLGCRTPADHPWMLSLWYLYRDGALHCATSAGADVVRYLEHDAEISFEVSDNEPPYRGVRGRGTASVSPDEGKELLRELMDRYLGGTDSAFAQRLLRPGREEVRIRVEPERVYSWDFTDRMSEVLPKD
jgi:nitroimidazol reductase NimA-like FMN-containing flavoprotein (pyridoxamine 5'-phosphate oxidase superfamily)